MCTAVILGIAAVGALAGGTAARDSSAMSKVGYEQQSAVERSNTAMLEAKAKDAITRGAQDETQVRMRAAQLAGTQRARFAAAGLDLNEGSPLAVLMDTEYMKNLDVATTRDNTAKEAWALRQSAATSNSNADFLSWRAGKENPSRAFSLSLLGSAGSVASAWYSKTQQQQQQQQQQ